jgi:hypothetical protein
LHFHFSAPQSNCVKIRTLTQMPHSCPLRIYQRWVGRLLGISERTAKAHVVSLLVKLHASDRAEAVARGFERGQLKP